MTKVKMSSASKSRHPRKKTGPVKLGLIFWPKTSFQFVWSEWEAIARLLLKKGKFNKNRFHYDLSKSGLLLNFYLNRYSKKFLFRAKYSRKCIFPLYFFLFFYRIKTFLLGRRIFFTKIKLTKSSVRDQKFFFAQKYDRVQFWKKKIILRFTKCQKTFTYSSWRF